MRKLKLTLLTSVMLGFSAVSYSTTYQLTGIISAPPPIGSQACNGGTCKLNFSGNVQVIPAAGCTDPNTAIYMIDQNGNKRDPIVWANNIQRVESAINGSGVLLGSYRFTIVVASSQCAVKVIVKANTFWVSEGRYTYNNGPITYKSKANAYCGRDYTYNLTPGNPTATATMHPFYAGMDPHNATNNNNWTFYCSY